MFNHCYVDMFDNKIYSWYAYKLCVFDSVFILNQ